MKNKIKNIFGLFYLLIIIIFILITFKLNINFDEMLEIALQNNNEISNFKNNNFIKISLIFFIFSIIWTIFLGIGLPIMFFAAFFYDLIFGTIIVVVAKSIGSTIMYFIASNFYKDKVKKYINEKKFLNNKVANKIRINQFKFFTILRMLPIPYQITDILPVLFNMKILAYFLSKFIGSLVSTFIVINILDQIFLNINLKQESVITTSHLSLSFAIIIFLIFVYFGNVYKKKLKKF